MKETLEKLWKKYLFEECSTITTDEEQKLVEQAAQLHQQANARLNPEQQAALEDYVDILCDIDSRLAKKAFFKGCEFAVSFLLETNFTQI